MVLGGRLPAPIALLIAATFAISILGAQLPAVTLDGRPRPGRRAARRGLAPRHLGPLRAGSRSASSSPPSPSSGSAASSCGCGARGASFSTYFAIAAASGAVTCLLALAFPALRHDPLSGTLADRQRAHHRVGHLLPGPRHLRLLRPAPARPQPHLCHPGRDPALRPARRLRLLRPALRGGARHARLAAGQPARPAVGADQVRVRLQELAAAREQAQGRPALVPRRDAPLVSLRASGLREGG